MNKRKTPYELFGIEAGTGWKPLYQPILDRIDKINKETGSKIVPTQVKEKFGRLEFYLSESNSELQEMINEASEKSSHICENCGKSAETMNVNGWLYPFCTECYEKFCNHFNELIESYESKFEQGEENLHQEID